MTRVVLLLVCTLLTMELTLAGYSNNLLNLIIRPAGRSRSFKWLGRGDINNIPYVPRPIFIPRWIPRERPEYVAKWVPTTPGPQSSKHSHQQPGFGPPKTNTVVQSQKLPAAYEVAPAKHAAQSPPPVSAPAPVRVQTSGYAPRPLPAPAPAPVQAPSVQPSGYAPPHADDIIPSNNGVSATVATEPVPQGPIITEQPLPQPDIIPQTAIRNTFSDPAPEVPGEPSFSALIQDDGVVDLNGFRQVDPNSVIIFDQGNQDISNNAFNVGSNIVVSDDFGNNFNQAEHFTVSSLTEPNTFLLPEFSDDAHNDFILDDSAGTDEGGDLLFVVNSDSTLDPLTTPHFFNEGESIQSLQDNSGKSFDTPISAQLVDPIQSNIVFNQNHETIFNEDLTTHISQTNVVTKLNEDIKPDDTFLITQDTQINGDPQFSLDSQPIQNFQSNENPPVTGEFQLNQDIQPSEDPQFFIDSDLSTESNEFAPQSQQGIAPQSQQGIAPQSQQGIAPQSQQGIEPQQNFQSNENNELFLVNTEPIQPSDEFQQDQVAQFSNFQLGQRINFRPLPIQQHGTNSGSFAPSLPRPNLVAPPVSPVLASERSFSTDHSENTVAPSGRSMSDIAIPQPVPIPIGPLASVTLDFPKEGPGVRQARLDSGLLPFGARIHPRPARHFHTRRFVFGK